MDIIKIFHEGGFIMYPLLVFSILIWVVAIKKIFFLSFFTKKAKALHESTMDVMESKRFSEAKWAYKNYPAMMTGPLEVLFEEYPISREVRQERMYRRLSETQAGLKKDLWVLGTIGSSAPFVGLFGTVLGIMSSFKAIGESGKSGFNVVAAGISESLIATAAGIIVAVVAVLFYNYFQVKISQLHLDFKNKIEDIAEIFDVVKNDAPKANKGDQHEHVYKK